MCKKDRITHEVKARISSMQVWPEIQVEGVIPEHDCKEHVQITGVLTALENGEKVNSHNLRHCVKCGSPLDASHTPNSGCSANAVGQRMLKDGFDIKVVPTSEGRALGFEPTVIAIEGLLQPA